MGIKQVIVDDLTGKTLPDETEPVRLSYGDEAYDLYLSMPSYAKLLEALEPFTQNAEPVVPEATTKPAKSEAKSSPATDRVRLTGKDKEAFDKAMAEYKEAKSEQRVKMFEYAATTDKHKDAKDSGKNIKAELVEDFYAEYPDVEKYFGKSKTVEEPVNKDYKSS